MNAEIIAVGSEMLGPTRIDTNSLFLTDQLTTLGVEVVAKAVIGDDLALLTETIRTAVHRSDVVILSGGLGPTEDDLTREAVAAALGVGQTYRAEIFEGIAALFAKMGRKISDNNKRQANVIDGAEVLANERGTAPGQWIRTPRGGVVMLVPGPPREMTHMWTNQCQPRLAAMVPPLAIRTVWFRVSGMSESELDQLIAPAYKPYTNPTTTVLAKAGDIEIHLRARCTTAEQAQALVDEVGEKILALLGERIYSRNGDPLETVVGGLLKERSETVAVAESCTSGLLGAKLTDTPGSSAWFRGGYLVYANDLKRDLIGELNGPAVSEETAVSLARAAAERAGADWAISTTGVAGPDGGTEASPVGTVWIGVARQGGAAEARRFRFPGDRTRVRMFATQAALDMLRRRLSPGAKVAESTWLSNA
jgi:nicotinamide-nucleotide amidase